MSEEDNQAVDSEIFRERYRVIRSIGKGSFGEAILVRSKLDGKRYVAKTVDSASMTDKEKRDMQNEIRILAADCLKSFSADLERQAEKDRAEYEAKHGGAPPPPSANSPTSPPKSQPAPAPAEPTTVKQPSQREQMAALRGMSKDQVKQMLAKQSAVASEAPKPSKSMNSVSSPEVDDDGAYIAQKQYIAKQTRDLVGRTKIDSHPEEFGDANPDSSMAASLGGEHMTLPNGKSYNAAEGRKLLEKELGAALLQKAVDLYNSGTMAGMSNNELQRELNELVGERFSNLCNAIGQLALLESKF
eukprot:gene2344-1474_t